MNQIYFVYSNDANADHEVHTAGCAFLTKWTDKKFLGRFESSLTAVEAARKIYPKTKGCENCCYGSVLYNYSS